MMKRILIVDDDAINCMLAKHALVEIYEVVTVNSGKEALDFLEKEQPDLILMDIEMPEMDGKTVVKKIKACDAWNKKIGAMNAPRYGCGLCQVKVPCESKNPVRR